MLETPSSSGFEALMTISRRSRVTVLGLHIMTWKIQFEAGLILPMVLLSGGTLVVTSYGSHLNTDALRIKFPIHEL
jgi:hypothetical protein